MAQNSRPRSNSSASNKKRRTPEHTHTRSSRQVRPSTPRVLSSQTDSAASSGRRKSSRQSTGRRSSRTQAANARGTRQSSRTVSAGKRSKPQKRAGIGSVILIALVVVVLFGGGFVALYFSNFFPITNVQVSGNAKLQSSYISELAEVPDDSTFLRTDVEGIRSRLLAEPWIQEVSVERVFPDTLILQITEQPVAAVVTIVPDSANDAEEQWIISEEGIWITQVNSESDDSVQIDAEEYVNIPKIKDISAAVQPESGAQETDEGIINALALLRGFSAEMRAMVASISAPDAIKTTLILTNNVGVAFGAAEDIEAKEQAIATLLAEHEGTITYINVRVPDRASYRATE